MDERIKKIIYGFLKSGTTELPIIRMKIYCVNITTNIRNNCLSDIMSCANDIECIINEGSNIDLCLIE